MSRSVGGLARGAARTSLRAAMYLFGLVLILAVLLALLLGGCAAACVVLRDRAEVERLTSPDGAVDAVLVADGGCDIAGGGGSLELHTVASGASTSGFGGWGHKNLTATEYYAGEPLQLRWLDNRTLEVRYRRALINGFSNFDFLSGVRGPNEVELRLVPPEGETGLP